MSFVERAAAALTSGFSKTKAPATPAELSKKMRDTQERITELERVHATACLRWADDGDASDRDRVAAELEAARADLESLAVALKAALERTAAEERARLASLNASRVHGMIMRLRRAERAAAELADALQKAGEARRKLLSASADARTSAPSPLPLGSLTEHSVLERLIANEMHRVSFAPKSGALPGAKPPTLLTKDDPASLVPLADQLQQAHDWAIQVVKGEVAEARTSTPLVSTEGAPLADVAQPVQAREPLEEAPEVDTDALLPGTRSAEEIMASMPRGKLTLGDCE